MFPILIPPPTSLPIRSLWVFPVYQPWALVSCIQPGLVICFTLDSVHVSMLFFQNIPPLPSPTEHGLILMRNMAGILGMVSLAQKTTLPSHCTFQDVLDEHVLLSDTPSRTF